MSILRKGFTHISSTTILKRFYYNLQGVLNLLLKLFNFNFSLRNWKINYFLPWYYYLAFRKELLCKFPEFKYDKHTSSTSKQGTWWYVLYYGVKIQFTPYFCKKKINFKFSRSTQPFLNSTRKVGKMQHFTFLFFFKFSVTEILTSHTAC